MKKQTFIKYKSFLFVFIALSSICAVIGSGFLHHNTDHQTVGKAENSFTVIIDPGHGGEDGGAVGESGTIEKEAWSLDTRFQIRVYLSIIAGYGVI